MSTRERTLTKAREWGLRVSGIALQLRGGPECEVPVAPTACLVCWFLLYAGGGLATGYWMLLLSLLLFSAAPFSKEMTKYAVATKPKSPLTLPAMLGFLAAFGLLGFFAALVNAGSVWTDYVVDQVFAAILAAVFALVAAAFAVSAWVAAAEASKLSPQCAQRQVVPAVDGTGAEADDANDPEPAPSAALPAVASKSCGLCAGACGAGPPQQSACRPACRSSCCACCGLPVVLLLSFLCVWSSFLGPAHDTPPGVLIELAGSPALHLHCTTAAEGYNASRPTVGLSFPTGTAPAYTNKFTLTSSCKFLHVLTGLRAFFTARLAPSSSSGAVPARLALTSSYTLYCRRCCSCTASPALRWTPLGCNARGPSARPAYASARSTGRGMQRQALLLARPAGVGAHGGARTALSLSLHSHCSLAARSLHARWSAGGRWGEHRFPAAADTPPVPAGTGGARTTRKATNWESGRTSARYTHCPLSCTALSCIGTVFRSSAAAHPLPCYPPHLPSSLTLLTSCRLWLADRRAHGHSTTRARRARESGSPVPLAWRVALPGLR